MYLSLVYRYHFLLEFKGGSPILDVIHTSDTECSKAIEAFSKAQNEPDTPEPVRQKRGDIVSNYFN